METAKAVAVQAGIMDDASKYSCINGDEFRNIVGDVRKQLNDDGSTKLYIDRFEEFKSLINGTQGKKPLRVIARATP